MAVGAQCAKPELTGDGCPEIFSPVRCYDCVYDNICFAKAAGFLQNDCKSATNVQGQVQNMPVPEGTLPGNPAWVDTVVVSNMPVPGNPTVVDTVVVHNMPEPGGTLPMADTVVDGDCPPVPKADGVDEQCILLLRPVVCDGVCRYDNGCQANRAGFTEADCVPLEEPVAGMGPSTIAVGEPNPGFPILIGEDGIVPCSLDFVPVVCDNLYKLENLCLAQAAGYAEQKCIRSTVDLLFSQPTDTEEAIPVVIPSMAIPGKLPVRIVLSDNEEAKRLAPAPSIRRGVAKLVRM